MRSSSAIAVAVATVTRAAAMLPRARKACDDGNETITAVLDAR
jgi:hypothetical protein